MKNPISVMAGFLVLTVASSASLVAQQEHDCWTARNPDQSSAPTSLLLEEETGFLCQLVFERIATLQGTLDGAVPEPAPRVIVGPAGRFFSAAAGGGTMWAKVLVWNPDGSFLREFGEPGEGPGELAARGTLTLLFDRDANLNILDGSRAWSVFGSNFEFLRKVRTTLIRNHPATMHLTENGNVLITHPIAAVPDKYFHLVDIGTDRVIDSFGDVTRTGTPFPVTSDYRPSGYNGGKSFWAAGPRGGSYRLEEWALDGTLLRSIDRSASWFEPGFDGQGEERFQFRYVHVDDDGLLWVGVVVRDPRWRRIEGSRERNEKQAELFDMRYEVFGPDSGEVLASIRFDWLADDGAPPQPAYVMRGASRLFYRPSYNADGMARIDIFKARLIQPRE